MERSLVGCSAAIAADCAPELDHEENVLRWRQAHGKPARTKPLPAPRDSDGIPDGMCRRCGIVGHHAKAGECIDALRDRLSRFE